MICSLLVAAQSSSLGRSRSTFLSPATNAETLEPWIFFRPSRNLTHLANLSQGQICKGKFRAAFKFGRRVHFALRRKMLKLAIAHLPTVLLDFINRPSRETDFINDSNVK